ncbi:MAG: transglutaminase-like domain-containing protein [Microthrixaceae bacterium]
MDASHQLLDEMIGAPGHGRLERGLIAISTLADPSVEAESISGELDGLAATHGSDDPARLCAALFGDGGFQPNLHNYYDPHNSLVDRVLARRVGIPLSLAGLALSVAERCRSPLAGVGMPGHFLLAATDDDGGVSGRFFDPFDGGRELTAGAVGALHTRLLGRPLPPNSLDPVDHRAMLVRTLANLRIAYGRHHQLEGLAWVLPLLAECCDSGTEARQELAVVLTRLGRWGEASRVCATLARSSDDPARSERWLAESRRLGALLN